MRKIIIASIAALMLLLFSCSDAGSKIALPEGRLANYLSHTGMLASGDHFLVMEDDWHLRCFGPDGERSVDQNAVEAVRYKTIYPIGADDESFYFADMIASEHYGQGTGRRVYRYFPESGAMKLVQRDTAISNMDGLLGLEDVLSIMPMIPKHPNYGEVYYMLDGNRAVPGYDLIEELVKVAGRGGLEIQIPEIDFKFAASGSTVFFLDVLSSLYRYDAKTSEITKLDYDSVNAFFVTESRLFVLAAGAGVIDVLELDGKKTGEVELDGRGSMYSVVFDGDDIYFMSDSFELLRLSRDLQLHSTGFSSMDSRWCVQNGSLCFFADE